MSTGKWKPRDEPPDYRPTSLLAQIALKYEDIAALDARRAQAHGELAQLFRSASKHEKGGAPSEPRNAA